MAAISSGTQGQQEHSVLEFLAALNYRSGNLDGYLHEIACGVSRLLTSDWSIVTICHNGTGKILASSVDLSGDNGFSLHNTLVGEVTQRGQLISIEDARLESVQIKPPEGYLSYLGVPLQTLQGDCIGTICSLFHQPRHFTAEVIRLVGIFAELAATAIDNYQIYDRQKQLNQLLEAEIRERQHIEKALRLSETRFRILVENAADAFLLIDPVDGRIVDVNQRACENLGYTYEELLRCSINDIDMKFSTEELASARRQLVTDVPTLLESVYRRKDGVTFPIEANICLFESGEQQLELALIRNISDRKQAELAMTRLAEIGELAATIVHEVRNPLTTVLLGLTAFQNMELSERAQERLSLALQEAERLKRLLSEILLYAKRPVLQSSRLEVNQLIAQTLEQIYNMPLAAKRRIEFVSSLPSAWVLGDRDKLKQVFINVIKNACEAVCEGEVITWRVSPGRTENYICISIHNGGDPIPPDVLAKLPTPFFTTKPSGNGLGLAIVKQIVEAHGGDFIISSMPKIGTTVNISLPLLAVSQADDREQPS